jgi:hypothetical protein
VLTPDDEQFEHYLKQFRPLDPEPLPIGKYARGTRRWFVFAAWVAAAAAVLVVAVLTTQPRPEPAELAHAHDAGTVVGAERLTNPLPLTIGTANALLAQSPSVNATLDRMAFQPQSTQIPKGKHSAFVVLSKENTKL